MTKRIAAASLALHQHRKRGKYGNHITTVGGIKFHSKKEALRWLALKDMEKHGEISHLERQSAWPMEINRKLVCKLVIDFQYIQNGKTVCEDSKGYQTAESKLKMKLAAACFPSVDWRLS